MERDERVSMKVRIPRWQKERWVDHADRLDMTQSEFLRSMVQAGRRGFSGSALEDNESASTDDPATMEEKGSPGDTPRGDGLEDHVLGVLSESGYHTWDELLAAMTDDIEERLENALDAHQENNRVKYSGRNNGYTLNGQDTTES